MGAAEPCPPVRLEQDGVLLRKTAAADGEAFTALYERYWAIVSGFISRRCGPRAPLEDLTQEVFLRLWRDASHFAVHSSGRRFILGIARNVVREYARDRARRRRECDVASTPGPSGHLETRPLGSTGIAPQNGEVCDILEELSSPTAAALQALTGRQRVAIQLVVFEESTYVEAAAQLGCSANAVRFLLLRARGKLRRRLARQPAPETGDRLESG